MQSEARRLQQAYLKSLSVVVSMTIPVVISTALFSDEIVTILLGRKWMGAAAILRLLSPTVLFFALINPFSWFLRATGRVGRSLKTAFLICPVVILGILAGLRWGPVGVAIGYSTAMILLFVPVVVWAIHNTGITMADYWGAIRQPLISGILGGITGWVFKLAFHGDLSPLAMLICGLGLSVAAYACVLLFVMGQKEFFADLLSHLFQRKSAVPSES